MNEEQRDRKTDIYRQIYRWKETLRKKQQRDRQKQTDAHMERENKEQRSRKTDRKRARNVHAESLIDFNGLLFKPD